MKTLIMSFLIPSMLFASEISDIEFNDLIDREIKDCEEGIACLSRMDPFDSYTYYYLLGVKEGLHNAKCIFEEYTISNPGK